MRSYVPSLAGERRVSTLDMPCGPTSVFRFPPLGAQIRTSLEKSKDVVLDRPDSPPGLHRSKRLVLSPSPVRCMTGEFVLYAFSHP